MKSKLAELGFNVPTRRYGFGDDAQGGTGDDAETSDRHHNGQERGMSVTLAA